MDVGGGGGTLGGYLGLTHTSKTWDARLERGWSELSKHILGD